MKANYIKRGIKALKVKEWQEEEESVIKEAMLSSRIKIRSCHNNKKAPLN